MLAKLYSYYFTNLFQKNWIRLILFTLLAAVGVWFLGPFIIYYLAGKGGIVFTSKGGGKRADSFRDLAEIAFNLDETRDELEQISDQERSLWENWEEVRQQGNGEATEAAKQELLKQTGKRLRLSSVFSPFPLQECGYIELSLGVKNKNSGLPFWGLVNSLSFWALTAGASFFGLTGHLVDFLFLTPKKSGEEAMVLSFTPGVKRSDLLMSKILVFLTYYSLFGLATFVLPGFFYYLWVGSLAPLNLVILFLYVLFIAPLLAFGLVIIPYLLFSSWSSFLGSLFFYLIFSLPFAFFVLSSTSPWGIKIRNWFFYLPFFILFALGVGALSLFLYYRRCQAEDLKV